MKCETISDYTDDVSTLYKNIRKPVGIDIIIDQIEKNSGKDPVKILDCGCGCGNYLFELKSRGYDVVGIDGNKSMLKHIKKTDSSIKTIHADITKKLPFKDNEFDVIIINQVLHHFNDDKFEKHKFLFEELNRISKPHSLLSINTSNLSQHIDGLWWGEYIKDSLKQYCVRYCPRDTLCDMLESSIFYIKKIEICKEPLLGEKYYDMDYIFDPEIRNTDTLWKYVSDDQYKELLMTLRFKPNLKAYFEERIKLLDVVGQSSFYIAINDKTC